MKLRAALAVGSLSSAELSLKLDSSLIRASPSLKVAKLEEGPERGRLVKAVKGL